MWKVDDSHVSVPSSGCVGAVRDAAVAWHTQSVEFAVVEFTGVQLAWWQYLWRRGSGRRGATGEGRKEVRDGREERMGESWLPLTLTQLIIKAGFQYFVMSGSCFKSLPS